MDDSISVVIVGYNRPKDLVKTVCSLLDQIVRPFEIIVIDDGSNPPISLPLNDEIINLVRFDKEVGLSNSRNFGIKMAKGGYVAFIDDDAVADKGWIEEIQKCANGSHVLGGPIRPLYEATPPDWWSEKDFGGYVGVGNIWVAKGVNRIWGTNLIVKREVFDVVGFFNPKLGRQKGKLVSYEENDFIHRCQSKGLRVRFIMGATVYHKVLAKRMTPGYIIRWSYQGGKSQKAMLGFQPLETSLELLHCGLVLASPRTIVSNKRAKINLLAWLARLLGLLL
jgi:GT2 family glycosyltransferase